MPTHFSEPVPGGSVSGSRAVERQAEGLIVEYALESAADETVAVRLLDRLPTETAAEFGFHEEHEPAEWQVADGELAVEATLDPGSEQTYVLGMVASDGEKLSCDAAAPDLEVVDADESAGDGAGFFDSARGPDLERDDAAGNANDVTDGDGRDVASTTEPDPNDVTGPEASPAPSPEPGTADPDDRPDRADGEAVDPEGAGPDAGRKRVDADGGIVNPEPESGGVASALIAELESGTVSESQRATLEEHLGVDRSGPESVRLEYVQKRLADFDAYVDALEDLLSVHGSGDDAITEIDERLERLEGFADDVEAIRRRQDELAERLDDLSEAVDAQAESIESLRVDHEEEFDDLQQTLDADLAALEAEVEAFESIRRRLVDGLQRPDDTAPGTTVEDAAPDALDGTEAIPIVDPSDAGRDGSDDPDVRADGTADAEDGSESELPAADANLEESLEAAEASNYSVSAGAKTERGDGSDSDEESEPHHSDEAFVPADFDSTEEGWDDATGADASNGDGDPAAEVSSIDFEDAGSDGDTIPEIDELESDPAAERADEEPIGESDADAGDEDADAGDEDAEENDDETEVADDPDEAADPADPDDTHRAASSIFEIGDVDTEQSSGEEKPTIDFEDS